MEGIREKKADEGKGTGEKKKKQNSRSWLFYIISAQDPKVEN